MSSSVSGWFILSAVYLVLVFGLFFTFTDRKTWPERGLRLGPSDMRLVPQVSSLWCEALEMQSTHAFVAYQGDVDVQRCLQSLGFNDILKSSEYDSDESSEEDDSTPSEPDSQENACSSLIAQKFVDVSFIDGYSTDCSPATRLSPLKVNVTSADDHVIVMVNLNRQHVNQLNLQIFLDRTRYVVRRYGQPLDICSLSTLCTIGLDFASGDRVLVSIPEELNSGRYSYEVQYRCKPRLAVFAILCVLIPLLLFVALAIVIRTDRETLLAKICFRKRDRRNLNPPRFASPLLEGHRSTESFDSIPVTEEQQSERVDEPPSYHSLYDPPPPYSCVGDGKEKMFQSR